MERFAIHYRPGAEWKQDQPWQEQGLYAHGEYMDHLFNQGILLYGGPFNDHTGGLAIIEVGSLEVAKTIIQKDPAVQSGIFVATAHPWITVFDQPKNQKLFKKRKASPEAQT